MLEGDLLGRSHDDPATTLLGKRSAAGVMVGMALLALIAAPAMSTTPSVGVCKYPAARPRNP